MGMSESELMDTTPYAFNLKVEGWTKSERRRERSEWERARWLASVVISPHLKKPMKPTGLFRFDDEKEVKPITEEDNRKIDRVAAKFERKFARENGSIQEVSGK